MKNKQKALCENGHALEFCRGDNVKVVLTINESCELLRFMTFQSAMDFCAQLTKTRQALFEHSGVDVKHIAVFSSKTKHRLAAKPMTVVNMCGKIQHDNSRSLFNDNILPLLSHEKNCFGQCQCVYTPLANIQTTQSNNVSLVRGARNSATLITLLSTSSNPDA